MNVASKTFMLLGECVPCVKHNASKFRIKRQELDPNLLMYFRKDEFVYAHDPEKKCKTGDVVLIEKLPQKLTRLITHRVKEIVFPLGDITDPITGEKVVVAKYRKQMDAVNKVYGKNDTGFEYDKAPDRGWLEDKKDFTHRDIHVKYDDRDKSPYSY